MASRSLPRLGRASSSLLSQLPRTARFHTSSRLMETPTNAVPVRKPVGAFRGGLLGFLLGTTVGGGGLYYYVLDQYKIANELLTQDIFALQAAVGRIEDYVKVLEEKVDTMQKKK